MGPKDGAARWTTRTAVGIAAVALVSGCGGGGDDGADPAGAPATADRQVASAFAAAERAMSELDDYTFRGLVPLPEDSSNPLGGRDAVSTTRVTADGRCETIVSMGDGVTSTRRTIDGTSYQQFSDAFLEISELDGATKDSLRGRWTAQPDDAGSSCDVADLSGSVDLTTAREVGPGVVRGVDGVEYEAEATEDPRASVRVWIAAGPNPLVLKLESAVGGVDTEMSLVSYDDGFTIDEPAPDLVIQPAT